MSVKFLRKKKALSAPTGISWCDISPSTAEGEVVCPFCDHCLVRTQRSEFWKIPAFFLDISYTIPITDQFFDPEFYPVINKFIVPRKNWNVMRIGRLLETKTWKTCLYPEPANTDRYQISVKHNFDLILWVQKSYYLTKPSAFQEGERSCGEQKCCWNNLKKRLWEQTWCTFFYASKPEH